MGLGYPGGPLLEKAAEGGDPTRFELPRPMKGRPGCDFSFSGLKTAVRNRLDELPPGPFDPVDIRDLAAGFQAAVGDVMVDRCTRAIAQFRAEHPDGNTLVVAGGVAANKYLRARLTALTEKLGFRFQAPPLRLCTDNAAMIAWAGVERLQLGQTDTLDFAPRPRWPLDPTAKKPAGKGAK